MITPLIIVAPVFGLMLLGFAAAKLRALEATAVQGLVVFVFDFAIPALLFRSLAQTDLPADVEWRFLLSFYGGVFGVYALGMGVGRFFLGPLEVQAIFGMSAGFSNTVLLGIPILLTVFGPQATLPIFLIVALHSPTLMPLTVILIQIGRNGTAHLGRQLRSLVRNLVGNPIIMSLLAGLAVNQVGISLPGPLDAAVGLLGVAAVPCALFAMGASLAAYPLIGDVPPALLLVFLKLVVHPVLVWVLAVPVLGLEGISVPVSVIMAAMPTGVNAYLFATRYGAAAEVAARTVSLGTAMSVVSISAVLYIFQA